MSIEFFKAGLGLADEASVKLNNSFARSATHQTDLLFEDIWQRKNTRKQEKYSKADYERYGFSSQRQAMAFVVEMQKIGVDVAVAPVKLNGQVLVELHKDNDNVLKLEGVDGQSEEQNPEQPIAVTTESYTASQLVEWYKQETFEEVQAPIDHEFIATPQSTVKQEANALKDFVTQNLDFMGVVVNRVSSGYDTLRGREYGSETMRKSDDRLFNQSLRTTTDKEGNAIREADSQHIKGRLGKAKKAIVIDDVVIIDGQRVSSDSKQYQYVMNQHQSRLEKADVHIQRAESHINRVNAMNNVSHSINDVMQQTAAYKAVDKGGEALHNIREGTHRFRHNARESVKSLIHNHSFSDRFAETELGVPPRYVKKEYQQNEYNHLQIHDRQEALRVETRRKNAEAVKDGKIQEYVSSETVSRALRKGGYLDEFRNTLNTQVIINQTIGTSSLGMALASVNDVKTKAITNESFFHRMKGLHEMGNLPESVQKAIGDAIAKVETEGLDAGDVGKALRKEVEKHANIEVNKISESNKIDVSLVDGKPEWVDTNKILKSLDNNFGKELGIDFMNGGLTRENILAVNLKVVQNAEKLNINLVTASGKLDTKLLSKLNTKQLKELGLDKRTTALLIKLNQKGAWGNIDFGEFTGFASMAMRFSNKLVQDEDMQKMTRASMQTVNYSRRAVSTAKQFGQATREGVEAAKARLARTQSKLGKEPKPPKKPKDTSEKALKKAKPYDEKKVAKFEKKQAGKAAKLAKAESGKIAKAKQAIDTAMKAAGETILSALGTILMYLGIGILIIWGLFIIILLIVMLIQSLLDWNPFEAETYQDTVCYHLYDKMEDLESSWIEDVEKVNFNFSDFTSFYTVRYGVDNEYFEDYLGKHPELHYDLALTELYINPFSAIGDVGTTDDYSQVYDFANRTFAYSANINKYGEKDGVTEQGLLITTENGHTSNIKDIIGMVDTMFSFDMDGSDDGSMKSILGMTPKGMDFENLKNKFKVVLKNIGTFFKKLFGGDEAEDLVYLEMPNSLKYDTVASYAVELYGQSHQQLYTFDVVFHPLGKIQVNVEGSIKDLAVSDSTASALGVCTSPVTNDFKLMLSGTDIVPYVTNSAGQKYNLDTDTFDVRLGMHNGTYIDDDQCLWEGMTNNISTYTSINSHMSSKGSDSCWNLSVIDGEKTFGDSVTGNWYNNKSDAENDAINKLAEAWNNWDFTGSQSFSWTPDSLFERTYEEKYNYDDDSEVVLDTKSESYKEWEYLYWTDDGARGLGDSGNGIVIRHYFLHDGTKIKIHSSCPHDCKGDDWSWDADESNHLVADADGDYNFYYVSEKGKLKLFEYLCSAGFLHPDYYYSMEDMENTDWWEAASGYPLSVYEGTYVDKTKYQTTAKAPFKIKKTDRYTRSCKGHDFRYCGGHVNLHSQGITYSITNEQLSESGLCNESQNPAALNFDLKANGYSPILGKVNTDTISYANVSTAASTGGCVPASSSPQGSDVACRGLNLYTEGATWKKGTDIRSDVDTYQYRDIFDCDCAIDKGCDVFPVGKDKGFKHYDGWTDDNITFATMKSSGDWLDSYEFDIPTEVGGQFLSQTDIEKIMSALQESYGDKFTETRQEAVRLALNWVGKGHYSNDHKDHAFLSEACTSKKYSASCSATDDEGFMRYILYKSGKLTDANGYVDFGIPLNHYASDVLPADILKHHGGTSYADMVISEAEYNNINSISNKDVSDIVRAYRDESYVIYLGKINSDITLCEESLEKKVKTTIKAGSILTVDINNYDGAGSVKLRAKNATGYTDIKNNDNMFDTKTYYWVIKPDSRTYVHKYE